MSMIRIITYRRQRVFKNSSTELSEGPSVTGKLLFVPSDLSASRAGPKHTAYKCEQTCQINGGPHKSSHAGLLYEH